MKNLLIFIAGALVLGGGIFAGQQLYGGQSTQQFGAFNPTGGGTYFLQSPITNTQTTIALSSFKEPGSNIPYTMSYLNSDIEYATINPIGPSNPNGTKSEFVSFTGITQNSNGTALLTGVTRGLERSYPYGASSTLAYSQPGQTQFILSATPQFYAEYYVLRNMASSTNTLSFSNTKPPLYYPGPGNQTGCNIISTTSELASVAYVNCTAFNGAPNATTLVKGISQLATAAQQASSTAIGSTLASLVLTASTATDTPQAKCNSLGSANGAGCNPIADLAGNIWKTVVGNLSIANAWAQLQTFTSGFVSQASSTFNATTTQACSNILSNACKFNTVPYQFPSAQGSINQFLQNNGSGVLSWASVGTKIGTTTASSTTFTNVNTTMPEATVSSVTVPGNTLTAGGVLYFDVPFGFTCSGGTGCGIRVRIKFGGTTIFDDTLGSGGTAGQTVPSGNIHLRVMNQAGLTNAQYADVNFLLSNQVDGSANATAFTGFTGNANSTASIDTTSSQTLVMTLTIQGVGNDTISQTTGVGVAYYVKP